MSVAALGLGAVFVGASTTALANVAHHEAGIASGILSTFHEFGAALGVAVTSSLAVVSITGTAGEGIDQGLTFAAVAAAASALLTLVSVPAAKAAEIPPEPSPHPRPYGLGTGTSLTGVMVLLQLLKPGHRNLCRAVTSSASTM
jgi:hypothetical protein